MTTLVIAPHADDEVFGAGGTIARAVTANREEVVVAVLTGHGEGEHPLWPRETWDVVREECRAACGVLGVTEILFRELPAACLDATPGWYTNQVISDVIREVSPTDIYVPYAFDLHRDHQAIAYGVTVGTRAHLPAGRSIRRILAYETLSETHLAEPYFYPAFQPNFYVDITEYLDRKLAAARLYVSQLQADSMPRSLGAITALARFRGAHIGTRAAEGFVLIREVQR